MDRYLTAMLTQDVSDDLVARNIRFTESGIELPLIKAEPLIGKRVGGTHHGQGHDYTKDRMHLRRPKRQS